MYKKYVYLREKHNVNDATVAKETGITRSTFTAWKQGISSPKIDKIKKIANYFGVDVDYFLDS